MHDRFITLLTLLFCAVFTAQNYSGVTVQNAHSHNDYAQKIPFWSAYSAGFGSIEADVFFKDGQFYVAHEEREIAAGRTLDQLYLTPLKDVILKNKGTVYPNAGQNLQLLIELKQDYHTSLAPLISLLEKSYPELIHAPSLKITLTGKIPPPAEFSKYPAYLYFDGDPALAYTPEQMQRVAMFSADLHQYTKWGGKGIMRDEESAKLRQAVQWIHAQGKKARFWSAPDFPNAWVNLIDAGADYINTDHIDRLADFLTLLPKNFYQSTKPFARYQPTYGSDGKDRLAKNVILMIPDGVSLPQWYAAFTANKGYLNAFQLKYTGLSKTNSANAYITDSAPGSTAFATGVKTKNNFVGVDAQGKYLRQIPEIIASSGKISALITTGDVTDATPADFYAHNTNRDNSEAILQDFIKSPVRYLVGGPTDGTTGALQTELAKQKIKLTTQLAGTAFDNGRIIVVDPVASKNYAERGKWLGEAFDKTLAELQKNKSGFFMMVEASRTDINAHANHVGNAVEELLDFDEVVGKALQFADKNQETLVVILGDHETGGLTLLDGSLQDGWVLGSYSTNDHTALPVTSFAYGPGAAQFTGFFENTDIFRKILASFGIRP